MGKSLQVACPTCSTPHAYSTANLHRPFCSERCKLIDLGAWAEEKYRIAGKAVSGSLPHDGEGGSVPTES